MAASINHSSRDEFSPYAIRSRRLTWINAEAIEQSIIGHDVLTALLYFQYITNVESKFAVNSSTHRYLGGECGVSPEASRTS